MEEQMDGEIRRIFLKYIVLTIINDKPTHGYELLKQLSFALTGVGYQVQARFILSLKVWSQMVSSRAKR